MGASSSQLGRRRGLVVLLAVSETPGRPAPGRRPGPFSFFPMRRSEGLALAFLIAFSIVSFLPPWRELEVAGMAVFGWLMAALMLVSPALMLLVFRRGGKR